MKKKRIYISIILVFVSLITFGILWTCWVTRDIGKDVEKALNQSQRVEIKNMLITETKDHKKYWELYAKTGDYNSGDGLVNLHNILGNFYDKDEKVVMSFQSPKGTYNEKEKIITLIGETYIVIRDGSSIRADKFVWRGTDEDIVASGNVIINRNNELVTTSEEAIFNSDLTFLKVNGKTKTRIYKKTPEIEVKR